MRGAIRTTGAFVVSPPVGATLHVLGRAMNWDEAGAIGELVGVASVGSTLVHLSI